MTSTLAAPTIRPCAKHPRRRYVLIGVGCALLLISLVLWILQRPAPTNVVVSADPRIEVRARFAGLTPTGQTTGFAVAPDGSMAVVDRIRKVVIRLDATGAPITEWGPRFEADADAEDLTGITAAGSDWYLLDRGRTRILRLDANGRAVHTIDLQPLATYGPNGLATDAVGNLYLADTGGNRILVFSPTGTLLRSIGTPGAGLGQLKQPMGLSFGPDGAMYISDLENSRVERWGPDQQPTNSWTLPVHAWGIVADRLGRIFVTDVDHRTVRVFGPQGDVLAEIGTQRDGVGIDFPTQLGVSPDGSALWVLGKDGLAHVDLTPYSQAIPAPVQQNGGTAFPIAAVGAVLVAAGAAPLLRRPRVATRPSAVAPYPAEADRPAPTRPIATGRARVFLQVGMSLVGLGLLAAALCQLLLQDPAARNNPWAGLGIFVVSGVVWAIGCGISARALPFGWVSEWPARRTWYAATVSKGERITAGVGVAMALIAAGLWWFGRFETQQATVAALIWLTGLALIAVAIIHVKPGRRSLLTLVPLLLFVVAIVPRVWQAGDLPFGVWYDEAQGALEVRRVVQQGTYTPILNTYGKDTSGFFYLMPALSVVLGDNIVAVRTAAALVGSLTPPVTYLLGRELFGWRVGVAAGAILAFSRWHVNFSRLGFNPISLPLCAALAFWLLARAVRTRQWLDIALAGLALGVGMHAYTGFRGMPIVALFALGFAALAYRWSARSILARFGLYLGAFALTALPVLIFALKDPVTFNGRTTETLILTQQVSDSEKLRQIWDTVQRHALMFNVSGDLNGRHNLPGAPMLDALTAVLVVLGLGWLIVRWHDWRTATLLAWCAVSLSGGILTLAFEAPQGVRTFGLTPVVAVLAGVGLVSTLDRLRAVVTIPQRVRARRATLSIAGAAVVAIAWIGYTNLDTFFNRQMRNSDVFAAFSTRETVPVRVALQERGSFESILASTTMTPSVVAAYMTPDMQAKMHQFDPAGDLPYRGNGPGLVFLETEHDQALADEVARRYPEAPTQSFAAADGGKPIVEGFRLDPELLASHRGLSATYRGADGKTIERRDTVPDVALSDAPVPLPADLSWHSSLVIDTTGDYSLRVPAGFQLRIDDTLLTDAPLNGVRVHLSRGDHLLDVAGRIDGVHPARLEWRSPGGADWWLIPTESLFIPPPGGSGLRLTVTAGSDPAASMKDEMVDPVLAHYYHVSPFTRLHLEPQVWTADWTGQLDVPAPGTYGFSLEHSQTSAVWIDDRQILGNLNSPVDMRTAVLQLTPGRHAIRVRYEKSAEGSPLISLFWTRPGAQSAALSAANLYPPPPEILGPAA